LDGPAWRATILDYAQPDSLRRRAQCDRIRVWTVPSWERHMEGAMAFLDRIALIAPIPS
jgi:hypothetical protein